MKIVQMLNVLDYGDGVSKDAINFDRLFKSFGFESIIYTAGTDSRVASKRNDISEMKLNSDDILIHHFYGKSELWPYLLDAPCKKVMRYHNITPGAFFSDIPQFEEFCDIGLQQLEQYKNYYDYYLCVSEFNKQGLIDAGVEKHIDVLPTLINFSNLDQIPQSREGVNNPVVFLFIGRIAPNKRHADIIDIFDYYCKKINGNSMLLFPGNHKDYNTYYHSLTEKVKRLGLSKHIVFMGKVSDEMIRKVYSEASIFICMSEHEGFCNPLLESMYCGIPTIAYDAGAIADTMGDAGVLVYDKDPEQLAKLCHLIMVDQELHDIIVKKQKSWVTQFSEENIRSQLKKFVIKWTGAPING
jgi:Glycosyltransferase